jgi:hypothetical protein
MRFLASSLALLSIVLLTTAFSTPQAGEGPVLTWRTLAGATRQTPLAQAPGSQLEDWMGPWMEPRGLQAPAPLVGADTMVVELIGGDRLFSRAAGGDGETLEVRCVGSTDLSLSIEQIASFVFPDRQAGRGSLEAASEGDRLYSLAGRGLDRVDGVLVGFAAEGVRFEGRLGEKLYPWADVVGLFIEALDSGGAEQGGSAQGAEVALVEWTDGSRTRGQLVSVTSAGVILAPLAESKLPTWTIPMAAVREMVLLDGSFRFLPWKPIADAGPSRSPFDPPGSEPLGMVWPHRIDRAVTGEELSSADRTWTQGIGVHAPSQLTWNLDGADCKLVLFAALDDSVRLAARTGDSVLGSVEFQVHVDGKQVWSSGVVTSAQGVIQPDAIDLSGAKTLRLVVTDGGDGPVLDRANWLRPLLIRCE